MEAKFVVACVGIAGATALGVTSLVIRGPDATVITALVGAITFIVGLAFGVRLKQEVGAKE